MANHKIRFIIESSDIQNKLSLNSKEKLPIIEISKVVLLDKDSVEIECLILDEELLSNGYRFKLIGDGKIPI